MCDKKNNFFPNIFFPFLLSLARYLLLIILFLAEDSALACVFLLARWWLGSSSMRWHMSLLVYLGVQGYAKSNSKSLTKMSNQILLFSHL